MSRDTHTGHKFGAEVHPGEKDAGVARRRAKLRDGGICWGAGVEGRRREGCEVHTPGDGEGMAPGVEGEQRMVPLMKSRFFKILCIV